MIKIRIRKGTHNDRSNYSNNNIGFRDNSKRFSNLQSVNVASDAGNDKFFYGKQTFAVKVVDLSSSALRRVAYDDKAKELTVEFNSGTIWIYYDFPKSEWTQFMNAPSQGQYYARHIRGEYDGERLA